MKKYLYIAIAAATLASCSQDEVMEVAEKEAITFGNVFVGKSTRAAEDPGYSGTADLTSFQVWGAINAANNTPVAIFADDAIGGTVGQGSVWENTDKSKQQYWIYGATYNFAAVVNTDLKDGKSDVTLGTNLLPQTINYTADGTKDLLYAEAKNIVRQATDTEKKVSMNFSHLLSKVKFTAVNTTTDTDYTFNIKNLTITNSPAKGTYYVQKVSDDKPAGKWDITNPNGTTTIGDIDAVVYGSKDAFECEEEKFLIPADFTSTKLNISYTLEWVYAGNVITSTPVTATASVDLKAGYAYNFQISTALNAPIQFTVTQDPSWTTATDQPVTVQ